jgi:putative salt-induced outer membrane protein YdiY
MNNNGGGNAPWRGVSSNGFGPAGAGVATAVCGLKWWMSRAGEDKIALARAFSRVLSGLPCSKTKARNKLRPSRTMADSVSLSTVFYSITMHLKKLTRASFGLLALLASIRVLADVVETKNGARIVGKVAKIESGNVIVETDFAGKLTIKQSEVTGITTDAPVTVRLQDGTRMAGRVSSANGSVQVAGTAATITTTVDKVAASWDVGGTDPDIVALERHWKYEASADVTGKTGNKEQLGTSAALRATLKTAQDTLQFYSAYDREVSDGAKSADQFKAGVDYQDNFAGKLSWYVRDEGGFDRVKDIRLYNVAGAGFGYDFLKEPKHTLTGRAGLSYRYEAYNNPATPTVSSAGLDLGLNHEWELANSKIVNRISYVPLFDDFSNFRLNHESFYEVPLTAPAWKLRLGVSNDYNSKPGKGVEKLDTTYFTRLVLDWE